MGVLAMINIEIAYAGLIKQIIISLQISPDATVEMAVRQSGILKQFPEIDLTKNKIGIFGNIVTLETTPRNGDRIEIYRALFVDPKQARLQRAKRQRKLK